MNNLKFCLNSRMANSYLEKADEISIDYRDRGQLLDFIEKYPKAQLIISISYLDEDIDWKQLGLASRALNAKGRSLIARIPNLKYIDNCKEYNIKYFYGYEVDNFYELQTLLKYDVCALCIGPQFSHSLIYLPDIIPLNVELRHTLGRAISSELMDISFAPYGYWVRPEDIDFYEQYYSTYEILGHGSQAEAMYRIYAEQKSWSGDLTMIVKDMTINATNRMIPPDLAERRARCEMICLNNGMCNKCERLLKLANPDLLRDYKK